MQSDVVAANIEVHSIMAESYNANEPHFRPENKAKVRSVLENLCLHKQMRLLDLGCGTGFIIDLAKDLFAEIHGVDVTQAMLDKVDLSSGNIKLHNVEAEHLPFVDIYFDIATAYAFIHHTLDYEIILKEAYRVLKKGGSFYIDLEPNKLFWQSMVECDAMDPNKKLNLSDIVLKEIDSVLYTDDRVEKEFAITKDIFNKAEYTKSFLGGIDPNELSYIAKQIGYKDCEIQYQWYLGQGAVMHQQSFQNAEIIEQYLRRLLPLSAKFFKYLRFILIK